MATNQPTINDLNEAWTAAIECEDIGGAFGMNLLALRDIRNARVTWDGEYEESLRDAVDRYLAYYTT